MIYKNIANEYSGTVLFNEPLSNHTTFKVGGNASAVFFPAGVEDIKLIINEAKQQNVPYYVLGRGSNVLASDKGFSGIIIKLAENMNALSVNGSVISAECGVLLTALVRFANENGLCGMEDLSGIPGTVGGAVVMNAGAYDGEIKMFIKNATVLDKELNIKTLNASELNLGYRHSCIPDNGYIVLSAEFELEKGDVSKAKERIREISQRRRDKQPLEFPSAGSTFKRPQGYFAGKLIQDSGLKGFGIGGAKISEKHAGFVINAGGATADDIFSLIKFAQEKVLKDSGVMLEREVKLLGEF